MDWLTLTMKPENDSYSPEYNHAKALDILRNTLLLDELFSMLEYKGSAKYYGVRLSYNDVDVKIADPVNFNHQGLCISFSSNGIRYFEEYLSTYGLTFRLWCARFRRLCVEGWITKCTRYDFAMDDKAFDDDTPKLTMKRVLTSICDEEISCKARSFSDNGKDFYSFQRNYKRRGGQGLWGTTVQIGQRTCDTIVRFYDKLIEQKQKGNTLPDNLKSWVRCEFEYKGAEAMSAFNAWLDLGTIKFSEYMCGRANDNVRFIYRTTENVTRCPTKRWWREFLNGCTKKIRTVKIKPRRTELSRAEQGLKQYARKNYTFLREFGLEAFGKLIQSFADELKNRGKDPIDHALVNNLREGNNTREEMDGFKWYDYTSPSSSKVLRGYMAQDYCTYNWHLDYINQQRDDGRQFRVGELADVQRGHEVICYGV
ncbi:MAG: replication initiation factor domain-containing protein [Oscillospiraceae bacterium]